MKVQKKINVSLSGNDLQRPVRVVATDSAIQLVLKYIDFIIPDGTTATLFVMKPSKKVVYQTEDIVIDGNTVTIDVKNQAIIERGKAYFTVTLTNGEDKVSTFSNYFDVDRNCSSLEAEESKTIIGDLISEEMIEAAINAYLTENPAITDEQLGRAIAAYFEKNPITGGTVTNEQIAQAVENYLEENPIEGGNGVGIESVEQTTTSTEDDGENIITITLTNGTQITFKVKNGSKGSAGVGIRSIEKTATVGLVDTYTITLTNGSKSTFTVTNGKDSASGTGDGTGTNGREVELSNNGLYIQWRYVGDTSWKNLVALSSLKGNKGDDGKTPVKGTDYFTEADKQEIVDDVLEQIEIPSGGGKEWTLIADITLTEAVNGIELTGDEVNGYSEFLVDGHYACAEYGNTSIIINNIGAFIPIHENDLKYVVLSAEYINGRAIFSASDGYVLQGYAISSATSVGRSFSATVSPLEKVENLKILRNNPGYTFLAGSNFKIYAR